MGSTKIQHWIKDLGYFLIFSILLISVFRDLIANIQTNLQDWLDYPYIVWVIHQNIIHLRAFDFLNFTTNAFYPYRNTMFFSDLLLPQSLIALPLTFISKNPILVFNITFLTTFTLNYISSFLLYKQIFKQSPIAFLGGLLTVFSPFFFTQISHFQMQNFWPFISSIYFLFRYEEDKQNKFIFLTGIFLAIQFLASIYLAIFLLISITLYIIIKTSFREDIKSNIKNFSLILFIFFLLSGLFIKGYINTAKTYNIKRDYGEYVQYSAHITDYIFSGSINSIIHDNLDSWNRFNKHASGESAVFPGFFLTIAGFLGILHLQFSKSTFSISFKTKKLNLFFLLLMITGFIFSLGPRTNFNGLYGEIPLPYHFITKIPLLSSLRSVSRWSFLFYLGLTYFALNSINKLSNKLLVLVFILIFLEYVPVTIKTHRENYLDNYDSSLKQMCSEEKTVVLELPVTHFQVKGGIAEGLGYVTKNQMATTYNNCLLVNGYSGFDMPELITLESDFYKSIKEKNETELIKLLKENEVNVLVVNKEKLSSEMSISYESFYPTMSRIYPKKMDNNIFIIN